MLLLDLFIGSISSGFEEAITVGRSVTESENEKTFLEVARIVIPPAMALLVFTMGQIITWGSKRCSKRKKLNMTKGVIEMWVKQVKNSVEINVTGLKDFAKELDETKELHPIALRFTPLLINKLGELKLWEIQEVIINLKINKKELEKKNVKEREYKGEMIYNIVAQIDYLSEIMQYAIEDYTKFEKYTKELMTDWNEEFSRFEKSLNSTSNRLYNIGETEHKKIGFWEDKNNICSRFLEKSEGKNMVYEDVFSEMLVPLKDKFDVFFKTTEYKKETEGLAYIFQNLFIIKMKWSACKDGHVKLANARADSIGNSYKDLKNIVNEMKTKRLVRWFRIK